MLRRALKTEFEKARNDGDRLAVQGIRAMVEGCAFLAHCDRNAERLPEPKWKHAADIFAHVKRGDEFFHIMSSRDDRYSRSQTEQKLIRAKEFGPKLCTTIAQDFPGCANCPFKRLESIATPRNWRFLRPAS